MKTKPKSRRAFLMAAGAGSAGAVVAVVAGKRGEPAPGAKTAVAEGDGYRVTDHILKYYKTTEV